MPTDDRHEQLQNLRIDRSHRNGQPAKWARNVFLTSIVYMPVLFAVMVFGRA